VLPRIGAALAEFIAPIATSSSKQATAQSHEKRAFQRWKRENPNQKEQGPSQQPPEQQDKKQDTTLAKVIPLHAPEQKSASGAPPGITTALFQLMAVLKEQRATVMRWLGSSAYDSAARTQKKNGRCRKGTILDHKAE
jgi:hypothetical protein